jgi:hypothetical protein
MDLNGQRLQGGNACRITRSALKQECVAERSYAWQALNRLLCSVVCGSCASVVHHICWCTLLLARHSSWQMADPGQWQARISLACVSVNDKRKDVRRSQGGMACGDKAAVKC